MTKRKKELNIPKNSEILKINRDWYMLLYDLHNFKILNII
jgi:hypothetical protein